MRVAILTVMFLSLLIQPSFGGSIQEPEPNSAFAWEIAKKGGAVLAFRINGEEVVFGHEEIASRQHVPKCETGMHVRVRILVLCFGSVMYIYERNPSYYRYKGGAWIDLKNEM